MTSDAFRRNGFRKNGRTHDIVGCEWDLLKQYFEFQFDDKMTWGNYGTYWEYDHIIPISIGDTIEDVIKLSYYTNLRPMIIKLNREKSNKVLDYYQFKFI